MTDLNQLIETLEEKLPKKFRQEKFIENNLEKEANNVETMNHIFLAADFLWDAIPDTDCRRFNAARNKIEEAITLLEVELLDS